MIEVTNEQELQKQLKQNGAVLALFYASWCPFCRNFISSFMKHAQTPNSVVYMRVKIDEDENPLWEEYSLEAVPSVIFFRNGHVAKRLDCYLGRGLSEKQFSDWLKTF